MRTTIGALPENSEVWVAGDLEDCGYSIPVGGTYRLGRVALCGLNVNGWGGTPWGIPGGHG